MKKIKKAIRSWATKRKEANRGKKEFQQFKAMYLKNPRGFDLKDGGYVNQSGQHGYDTHYVYHVAWGSRVLKELNPKQHVDIGSFINFTAAISAFIPIKFCEFRKPDLYLDQVDLQAEDLMELSFADDSIPSLSCMHVVEHVGLGRYGDTLDSDGDLKAMLELKRVLAQGGHLLFVVPMGKPVIHFNGHRVYSYDQIVKAFQGLEIREFSMITDGGPEKARLIRGATKADADAQVYGCGCFLFQKEA